MDFDFLGHDQTWAHDSELDRLFRTPSVGTSIFGTPRPLDDIPAQMIDDGYQLDEETAFPDHRRSPKPVSTDLGGVHELQHSDGKGIVVGTNRPSKASQPRRKKAPTLGDEVWEPYKARIKELYLDLDMTLDEVMPTIQREFNGFSAESVIPL